MSFSSDQGYVPSTVADLMSLVREGVNEQFSTTYTADSFLGTNFYKYFYALIQKLQENEVKTSEIVLKLQDYFRVTNEKILRPNTTSPGIFDYFDSKGYFVSTKPLEDVDAGKAYICVDVDSEVEDYADTKIEICGYVRDCVVAGVVSQGSEEETFTLENNQSFTFRYSLPVKIPVFLRLTLSLSENSQFSVLSNEDVIELLYANIQARYRLGMNFEPQRYFSIMDAPWAETVLLEWTDDVTDGELDETPTWNDTVYDAAFDEVFDFGIANIIIVES